MTMLIAWLTWSLYSYVFSQQSLENPQSPSISVLPVSIRPAIPVKEMPYRTGVVIATFLEQAGLNNLIVTEEPLSLPVTDSIDQIAMSVSDHVRKNPFQTEFVVQAEFIGTPASGVQAINIIVVTAGGDIHWTKRFGAAELNASFQKPRDPMSCSAFVSDQLLKLWQIKKTARPVHGKFAEFWKQDAQIPDETTLKAMSIRKSLLGERMRMSSLTVYPATISGSPHVQAAENLISKLNSQFKTVEMVATNPPMLIQRHSNEQKVLWQTARSLQSNLKTTMPTTDYVVFVDYGWDGTRSNYIHILMTDQSGEWVLVDYQNSHHAGFDSNQLNSLEACNNFVSERLKTLLRK